MEFDTHINGIVCRCKVIHYKPFVPPRLGAPYYLSEERVPSEFTFVLLDRCGHPAPALQEIVTDEDEQRLQDEYEATIMANKHGRDF